MVRLSHTAVSIPVRANVSCHPEAIGYELDGHGRGTSRIADPPQMEALVVRYEPD